jgi:hypothetical protein
MASAQALLSLPLAAPVPCFIISATRRLVNYNREFDDFIKSRVPALDKSHLASANLTLDAAIPKLVEVLSAKAGSVVMCGYSIKLGDDVIRGQARMGLASSSAGPLLVGYILAAES